MEFPEYADVFAWNEGELECCIVGKHFIDSQVFPPCHTMQKRFFWGRNRGKLTKLDTGPFGKNETQHI